MEPGNAKFDQSIRRQIEINQARTPTERFLALWELLDAAREMAPSDPVAQERRRRALALRQQDREQWRAQIRRFTAAQRADASTGIWGALRAFSILSRR